jgi:hypothetical protein
MKNIFYYLCVLVIAGCNTVTLNPKGQPRLTTAPTYEKSLPFFIFGLAGEHTVDAKEACHGRAVRQMQTQDTVTDALLTVVTFGIYAPRSALIWCDGGKS